MESGGLRTSSYTIYVDLPGNEEEMLLVHGYTGSYDRVSRRVATYLRSLEKVRPPKPLYGDWSPEETVNGNPIPPSDETIRVLKRRGYLTALDAASERELLARVANRIHQRRLHRTPGYIFMPTYSCNLRCAYCFQDYMRTNPSYRHLLRTISHGTVDRLFGAIPRIEELHGLQGEAQGRARGIGFFGGEPLLAENRPVVEYIMTKAREFGPASFWAVSNGTDLEAYEDLLGPAGINSIQITLDGLPEEHDKRRIYFDGRGSFERIARNITLALRKSTRISVRLNVDRLNVSDLPELAERFRAEGWDQSRFFSAYAAPVRAENDNVDVKTTFNSWQLDCALTELVEKFPEASIFARPSDGIKDQARRIFKAPQDNLPTLKESFCSAHDRMYIFDAFGDIYACWERTGDPNVRIGHVDEAGELTMNPHLVEMWRSRTVATNPVCAQCRYALHCGGGCAVLAEAKTGKYHSNFCDGYASRFRASVAEAYLDHVAGVELAAKEDRVCDM